MPRQVAPPPSGEFQVVLTKPFSGNPTHTVEIIGEPNRSAVVKMSNYSANNKSSEKTGDVSSDDVNELMTLVNELRGFPSHPSKDVYGHDAKIDLNTFEIQWSNADEDPSANEISEIAAETKDSFKRVAESIDALARAFAKNSTTF